MSLATFTVRTAVIVCAVMAVGCASVGTLSTLETGISSEADANRMAGPPSHVWNNPDGTRTLEYSNQTRDGNTAFMVTVNAAGKVSKVQQIIVDPATTQVPVGLTHEQVHRLLGTPRSKTQFSFGGDEVWDWNTPEYVVLSTFVRFNVHFRDGKVVRTSTHTVDRNDCNLLVPC